ncbi:putative urease accessory protein UreD [Helianthus anomalus]
MSGSSLLVVDWITSGRHESGEKWDFILYKSTNHIYMETKPLFLDTVFFLFL